MVATAVVGGTGLVGSNILSSLLVHPASTTVSAFTRKQLHPNDPHSRLRPFVNSDSSSWPSDFSSLSPPPSIFYSALGTTRGQVGSFEAQRKVDYDLNLSLARAAKDAGVKVYVLISSGGVSKSSLFPYSRMKAELDEAVSGLGFEKTVIVKPGLLVGNRTDSRPPEYILRLIANFMGRISGGYLKNFWAQDADVVGRAATAAGLKALEKIEGGAGAAKSEVPDGAVWIVGMADIIRMGRTEWNVDS